jgi:hypothetical protein
MWSTVPATFINRMLELLLTRDVSSITPSYPILVSKASLGHDASLTNVPCKLSAIKLSF